MGNQGKQKKIPYAEIKRMILACQDKETRAVLAYSYAFGCRIGELSRQYIHYNQKLAVKRTRQREKRTLEYISRGALVEDLGTRINRFDQKELTFIKPNFKQKAIVDRDGIRTNVAKFESFVNESWEKWLFDILVGWVIGRPPKDDLFHLNQSRMREVLTTEMRKYNSEYTPHWLRHSRGYDIAEITQDPYAVQAVLGHSDIRTSMHYVNRMTASLYKAMEGGKNFDDILGRSLVEGKKNGSE